MFVEWLFQCDLDLTPQLSFLFLEAKDLLLSSLYILTAPPSLPYLPVFSTVLGAGWVLILNVDECS